MKTYDVILYYSSFNVYKVKAKDKEAAIKKAKGLSIKRVELFNNLEPWHEADEIEELNYD